MYSDFENLKKYGEWEDYKNKKGNYESADDNDAVYESTRPGRPEIKRLYKKGTKKAFKIYKDFLLGPPALFGYFGNQFGKVPCNIVRPVRPQYTFFKALQDFEGKYIDELTYKEKDLIKFLGITIEGIYFY